jgi:hypothetical protein
VMASMAASSSAGYWFGRESQTGRQLAQHRAASDARDDLDPITPPRSAARTGRGTAIMSARIPAGEHHGVEVASHQTAANAIAACSVRHSPRGGAPSARAEIADEHNRSPWRAGSRVTTHATRRSSHSA